MPNSKDSTKAHAFDLMYNNLELSSGATRVHQYDVLVKQIEEKAEWLKTQEDKADILECFQDAYAVRDVIGNNYMLPEYRQGYLEFTDLDTISERFEKHKILRYVYRNRNRIRCQP